MEQFLHSSVHLWGVNKDNLIIYSGLTNQFSETNLTYGVDGYLYAEEMLCLYGTHGSSQCQKELTTGPYPRPD
jgi:hypothetical protein